MHADVLRLQGLVPVPDVKFQGPRRSSGRSSRRSPPWVRTLMVKVHSHLGSPGDEGHSTLHVDSHCAQVSPCFRFQVCSYIMATHEGCLQCKQSFEWKSAERSGQNRLGPPWKVHTDCWIWKIYSELPDLQRSFSSEMMFIVRQDLQAKQPEENQ